ncbi:MAG: type III secretion protein [Symbiopectobacterium sp.]|uniref:type III secretion protein n=1 Tax=Symbiopectobacterium sp. TaxID=2952789 RepID=UPI0039EA75FE
MRTVSLAELPEDCRNLVLIKSDTRKRLCRSQDAIEHTLRRCQEIHDEQKRASAEVKKQQEREGFSTGFQLFFTTILSMLNDYEALQHERWTKQRQHLQEALTQTLHDPVIVEYAIMQLKEHCNYSDSMTLILPDALPVPDLMPHITYLSTQENHITLQCGTRALRFPIEAPCQQWMAQADTATQELTLQLNALTPATLQDIIKILQQAMLTFTNTVKEEDE